MSVETKQAGEEQRDRLHVRIVPEDRARLTGLVDRLALKPWEVVRTALRLLEHAAMDEQEGWAFFRRKDGREVRYEVVGRRPSGGRASGED
jgi:hypothetical protein